MNLGDYLLLKLNNLKSVLVESETPEGLLDAIQVYANCRINDDLDALAELKPWVDAGYFKESVVEELLLIDGFYDEFAELKNKSRILEAISFEMAQVGVSFQFKVNGNKAYYTDKSFKDAWAAVKKDYPGASIEIV